MEGPLVYGSTSLGELFGLCVESRSIEWISTLRLSPGTVFCITTAVKSGSHPPGMLVEVNSKYHYEA